MYTSKIEEWEGTYEVTETIKEDSIKLKNVFSTYKINKLKIDECLKLIFIDDEQLNFKLMFKLKELIF